jgi:Protein of unknown function (DUF3341)
MSQHPTVHTNTLELRDKAIYGVVAQFDRPEQLLAAGHKVHHEHGFKRIDALTPFPIHGIDDAIGVPRSILGYIVFGCGVFGLLNAIFMVWYTNGYDYPLVIGGKPLFAWEFSIPPMFELTVLLASFGAVIGMLALNGLPRFYHPSFNYSHFGRATDDAYLLVVEASDPKFDIERTPELLRSLGAARVEVVEA